MRNLISTAIGLLVVAHAMVHGREIDRESSTITIQVDKSGWLASSEIAMSFERPSRADRSASRNNRRSSSRSNRVN